MVATTTFYLEGQDHARIALTREGLSALLVQVEAELHRSETYQQALNRFSQDVEETAQSCQAIIRAVGREAIRLALRQVVRQYRTTPSPSPLPEQAPAPMVAPSLRPEESTDLPPSDSEPAHFVRVAEPESDSQPATLQVVPSQPVPPPPPPHAIQKFVAKSLSPEAEKRAAMLQEIGQTLREAREAQGISLEQLNLKTWIPIHQLRALELGQADKLPEDIYIQGFIRRLAPVLKVDLGDLQGYIKPLQAPKSAVPSWYQEESTPAQLQPVHLYMGYAALMAGAASGLMWMSQQPHALQLSPNISDLQPSSVTQPSADADVFGTPQAAGGGGAIATPETAPPQALR